MTERPGHGGRDRGERTLDSVPTEGPRPRRAMSSVPVEAAPDEALATVAEAEAGGGAGAVVEVVVEPDEAGAGA